MELMRPLLEARQVKEDDYKGMSSFYERMDAAISLATQVGMLEHLTSLHILGELTCKLTRDEKKEWTFRRSKVTYGLCTSEAGLMQRPGYPADAGGGQKGELPQRGRGTDGRRPPRGQKGLAAQGARIPASKDMASTSPCECVL